MDQQRNDHGPIIREPTPGFPLTIYPYDQVSDRILFDMLPNKHVFRYNPHTDKYTYEGRIPIISVQSKHQRLLNLLHDYAAMLTEVIKLRRPALNEEEFTCLSRLRCELQEKRGSLNFFGEQNLAIFKELLNWYSNCEESLWLPVWNLFTCLNCSKLEMLPLENTIEMFKLLEDADCAEIRDQWEGIFYTHTQHTIEEIIDYSPFEELEKKMDLEESARRTLFEVGDYAELVLYYIPEVPEDVTPDGTIDEEHEMAENGTCYENVEGSHRMITRSKGRKMVNP